jgi:RarD protein
LTENIKQSKIVRGILLAMVTAVLWGFLPIFLKLSVKTVPAGSIACFRFVFAFIVLYLILHYRGDQPHRIFKFPPWLGVLAGLGLGGNYFCVTQAVNYSGPPNVAILIQTAPIMLVLIGVFAFKERLNRVQILGVIIAAMGFTFFYRDQVENVSDLSLYSSANWLILLAAALWAIYMLCQKILNQKMGPQSLNLLVYGVAALALIPMADWNDFTGLQWEDWALLVFLGVNTLIAYGAIAEAIKLIPLSLISMLVAVNPLITLAGMMAIDQILPGQLVVDAIGVVGYLGALTAITGVILVVPRSSTKE